MWSVINWSAFIGGKFFFQGQFSASKLNFWFPKMFFVFQITNYHLFTYNQLESMAFFRNHSPKRYKKNTSIMYLLVIFSTVIDSMVKKDKNAHL